MGVAAEVGMYLLGVAWGSCGGGGVATVGGAAVMKMTARVESRAEECWLWWFVCTREKILQWLRR
jgi:hypothetical protein